MNIIKSTQNRALQTLLGHDYKYLVYKLIALNDIAAPERIELHDAKFEDIQEACLYGQPAHGRPIRKAFLD